jgi:hypothetical protein
MVTYTVVLRIQNTVVIAIYRQIEDVVVPHCQCVVMYTLIPISILTDIQCVLSTYIRHG